ncbi:SPOR domain-containing protein [bacterium SCSIO 12643]|nr:SPOR domain-containing protein [bacterium SCSIO 12643]
MSRLIFFVSVFMMPLVIFSQENNAWKSFPAAPDTNTVKTGEGILTDTLSNTVEKALEDSTRGHLKSNVPIKVQELNEIYTEQSKNKPQIKGYTVLLYSGSGANSKLKARNILLEFNEKFPDCNSASHLTWKSPNYEVRIGDYRTKLEAERLLQKIKEEFPTAFVKKAMIELPALRPEEESESEELEEK